MELFTEMVAVHYGSALYVKDTECDVEFGQSIADKIVVFIVVVKK